MSITKTIIVRAYSKGQCNATGVSVAPMHIYKNNTTMLITESLDNIAHKTRPILEYAKDEVWNIELYLLNCETQ